MVHEILDSENSLLHAGRHMHGYYIQPTLRIYNTTILGCMHCYFYRNFHCCMFSVCTCTCIVLYTYRNSICSPVSWVTICSRRSRGTFSSSRTPVTSISLQAQTQSLVNAFRLAPLSGPHAIYLTCGPSAPLGPAGPGAPRWPWGPGSPFWPYGPGGPCFTKCMMPCWKYIELCVSNSQAVLCLPDVQHLQGHQDIPTKILCLLTPFISIWLHVVKMVGIPLTYI